MLTEKEKEQRFRGIAVISMTVAGLLYAIGDAPPWGAIVGGIAMLGALLSLSNFSL